MSSYTVDKHVRKRVQQVLLSTDHVTPSLCPGHKKWYKMVAVSGACKLGRHEKID